MTSSMNQQPYVPGIAADAVDLEGATVESGPETAAGDVDPAADVDNAHRDTDGMPVGLADAEADAAPN
jgi:hypothetical protein